MMYIKASLRKASKVENIELQDMVPSTHKAFSVFQALAMHTMADINTHVSSIALALRRPTAEDVVAGIARHFSEVARHDSPSSLDCRSEPACGTRDAEMLPEVKVTSLSGEMMPYE